jgi:hypothetical protein
MKKYLLLLFTSFVFAQTPFNKENESNPIVLKGMAYLNLFRPYLGYRFGIEKGFLKNQSIGIKYLEDWYIPRQESITDKSGIKHDLGDYEYDKEKSFIFEYKYYFFYETKFQSGFYASISYLNGKESIEKDINFTHDYYNQNYTFNYFGPAIGIVIPWSESSNWTIDSQFGYLFGKKIKTTTYELPFKYDAVDTYNKSFIRFEIMLAYNLNW